MTDKQVHPKDADAKALMLSGLQSSLLSLGVKLEQITALVYGGKLDQDICAIMARLESFSCELSNANQKAGGLWTVLSMAPDQKETTR